MTIYDAVGLAGTALILGTYALTVGGRIDAAARTGLAGNFVGASTDPRQPQPRFQPVGGVVEPSGDGRCIAGIGADPPATIKR